VSRPKTSFRAASSTRALSSPAARRAGGFWLAGQGERPRPKTVPYDPLSCAAWSTRDPDELDHRASSFRSVEATEPSPALVAESCGLLNSAGDVRTGTRSSPSGPTGSAPVRDRAHLTCACIGSERLAAGDESARVELAALKEVFGRLHGPQRRTAGTTRERFTAASARRPSPRKCICAPRLVGVLPVAYRCACLGRRARGPDRRLPAHLSQGELSISTPSDRLGSSLLDRWTMLSEPSSDRESALTFCTAGVSKAATAHPPALSRRSHCDLHQSWRALADRAGHSRHVVSQFRLAQGALFAEILSGGEEIASTDLGRRAGPVHRLEQADSDGTADFPSEETALEASSACTLRGRLWLSQSEKHRRPRRDKRRTHQALRSAAPERLPGLPSSPSALTTCARPVSITVAARSSRCGSTRPNRSAPSAHRYLPPEVIEAESRKCPGRSV